MTYQNIIHETECLHEKKVLVNKLQLNWIFPSSVDRDIKRINLNAWVQLKNVRKWWQRVWIIDASRTISYHDLFIKNLPVKLFTFRVWVSYWGIVYLLWYVPLKNCSLIQVDTTRIAWCNTWQYTCRTDSPIHYGGWKKSRIEKHLTTYNRYCQWKTLNNL
jgi:hypothetical protein